LAIIASNVKKTLLIGVFILALLSIYLYISLKGDYDIYYLSNDVFIDPALNENSIELEAPYMFNMSTKVIGNHFKLFESGSLNYESNYNELSSISLKIVRVTDDSEILLGYSIDCNYLIYWNKTRQYCDKENYISIEQDVENLIEEKNISKHWVWRMRHL